LFSFQVNASVARAKGMAMWCALQGLELEAADKESQNLLARASTCKFFIDKKNGDAPFG